MMLSIERSCVECIWKSSLYIWSKRCKSVTANWTCSLKRSESLHHLRLVKNYSSSVSPDWTVKEKLLSVCAGLWDGYLDGANFIVRYVDTAAEARHMPAVLAVARDIPHSNALRPLLESFAKSGFRVIMPYLPGSKLTHGVTIVDENLFSGFLGERSAFLLDFIGSFDIPRFDVAIGYCTECFPVLTLASNFRIFGSVVFLCPVPGHVTPRWIQPLSVSMKMMVWYKSWLLWPFAAFWFRTYVRRCVSYVRSPTVSELNLLSQISHGIDYNAIPGLAFAFESQRIPLVYVLCDGDQMVDCKISKEYAEIFGITAEHTDVYDASGQLLHSATRESSLCYLKAIQFNAPTHFPQLNEHFCKIISTEVTDLCKNQNANKSTCKLE